MQTSTESAVSKPTTRSGPLGALAAHWPEYLMEAAELGALMLCACTYAVLLQHPSSPIRMAVESSLARRMLMGLAMGSTVVAIIHSPFGRQSGAHLNPAVTLTFLILGKVESWDAVFYAASQFVGGICGVLLAGLLLGVPVSHSAVNFVVTVPGVRGAPAAFWAELLISFLLMSMVLATSNSLRLARLTPVFAGALVAVYISIEAPVSGMSMNPARTFGSALLAREWTALWVYFTAPPLGMLAAACLYRWRHGPYAVLCAKLHHHNNKRCIFRCAYAAPRRES